MSIETVGAYSPDIVYGHLTMPFAEKPVHINSHTPYDADAEEQTSFTQADFQKNIQSRVRVESKAIRDVASMEMVDDLTIDIGLAPMNEFPPTPKNIGTFQASNILDGTGVVYTALRNGYTPDKAIVTGNAYKSYSQASIQPNKNFIGTIVDTKYMAF